MTQLRWVNDVAQSKTVGAFIVDFKIYQPALKHPQLSIIAHAFSNFQFWIRLLSTLVSKLFLKVDQFPWVGP